MKGADYISEVHIGDRRRFKPSAFFLTMKGQETAFGIDVQVTGRVVGIHRGHGWYRVEYETHGFINHECFRLET